MPYNTTTTVQQIITGVSQDIRNVLSSTANPGLGILVDYTNRIHLQLLRASNWQFLLSNPQQFVTQMYATKYWIGATGGNSLDQVDTGLGLTDIRVLKDDQVWDRTNNVKLYKTEAPPLGSNLQFSDGTYRPGRPKLFYLDPENPYVLKIYPAPDNQTTYQPVPEAPICVTLVNTGSLPARFYYVKCTFVDENNGESSASVETKIFVPANMLVTVNPPQPPMVSASGVMYNRWKVYASTTTTLEVLQTASPLSTNITWTEPASGLVTGTAAFPTATTIEPIDGYLMEFRYFKVRQQLTVQGQVLQVPDDYKDIVIAGVNYLANKFLKRPSDAREWQQIYMAGVGEIVRDKWQFPKGADYIMPDVASIDNQFVTVESLDPGIGGGR